MKPMVSRVGMIPVEPQQIPKALATRSCALLVGSKAFASPRSSSNPKLQRGNPNHVQPSTPRGNQRWLDVTIREQRRLFQVEYAMEAIGNAGAAVGVLSTEGVVLAAEKKTASKLLDTMKRSEKMYKIDSHIMCAVAGITADANILINQARLAAQRYAFSYQEPIPVEHLLQQICDTKQTYTQFGGLRPFGVSFLFAGWDVHYGFQLYQSDPSGNYGGWKATSIGANSNAASSILKSDYKDEMKLKDALSLAIKVLTKTMDSATLSPEKLEISTVCLKDGSVVHHQLTDQELESLLNTAGVLASDKPDA